MMPCLWIPRAASPQTSSRNAGLALWLGTTTRSLRSHTSNSADPNSEGFNCAPAPTATGATTRHLTASLLVSLDLCIAKIPYYFSRAKTTFIAVLGIFLRFISRQGVLLRVSL